MDKQELINDLENLLTGNPWGLNDRLRKYLEELKKTPVSKTRTINQNNAMHLGFQFIADQLNETGRDMRAILKPDVDIPWSSLTVKEYLYRPIMKAHCNKESTTELTKLQVSEVWDIMMKFLGEKHGVEYVPFPSQEVNQTNYYSEAEKIVIK